MADRISVAWLPVSVSRALTEPQSAITKVKSMGLLHFHAASSPDKTFGNVPLVRSLAIATAIILAAHLPHAKAASPKEFAVAGVTLGMTPDQTETQLRTASPPLNIRRVAFRIDGGPASYVGAVVGEHPAKFPYDDDAIVVLFTRIRGRAYQILRERNYAGALTAEALKQAVQRQYGLDLNPAIPGIAGMLTARADYDISGNPTKDLKCKSIGVGQSPGMGLGPLLDGSLLGSMQAWQQYAPGCGVTFVLNAQSPQNMPHVIDIVTQQLFDQHALAEDAAAAKAADVAAAAKADKNAVRAAHGTKPGL